MEQPKKSKFTYDALFEKLAKEESFKNLERNKKEQNLILNNAFNTEQHQVDFDSSNQDYLKGDENPYLNQFADMSKEDPYNEIRADNQSGWSHLGIGAVRTVAKAATEIAKLPGVIGGIAMSPFAEENEGFETAFNNQWIKFFDGLNEDVKEVLPVYVKESVKNGDFFEKIGSSATWATEGADGAGYMLGALAPGGLFKYFGGAAKIFGTSAKAAKLGTFGKSMEAGRKVLKAAGITTKNIDQYMIPAFNTFAEAGAESKGVWDGMESRRDDAHKEYMSKLNPNDPRYQSAISLKNEELDQLRRSGEISIEEYNQQSANVGNIVAEEMFEKDFKEQKALAAQNTFFKNVVVLAGPNYIQAKLLFGKTPSKVLLDKIGGLGEKSIKNTVKQGVKNFAKGFASEGAEEVGQSAVEHRNIEEGLKFKLGNDRVDDYNPLTFGDDFIKTLGTTEGQMAGFLGGIMGAPMSTVGGYFQDKSDRKQTERLREKINGASTAYADIKNTNIYEQEEYTNPETGEVGFRDKEVDGKKVFIPENVAKVKNALDLIEKDSNEYDNAVEDGDIEKIEQFRNKGETNVILNFIGEDEVTLDALHEHLKVVFPTENSKDISDEQVKINKTNLERIDKIMSKAKSLQKDFVSFKDMSTSIIRINNPEITENSTKEEKKAANEHLADFLNRTAMTFLSERGEEYEAKQVLSKLEKQRLELEKDTSLIEIDNPNYIEGVSSEFDKKTKFRDNPRLDLVNSLIDDVKEKLKGYEENTNKEIWDNKFLNEEFTKEVELRKQIKEDNSPEQVAKNDEVITAVKSSTTEDEVTDIEKNAPKDVIKNPVIKAQINNKKAEIIQAEKVANETQIAEATQEDNDFNDTTVYTDLTGTEGSPITDDLIPEDDSNSTAEEIKKVKNEEVVISYGAQVISSYLKDDDKGEYKSGETIPFMLTQYEPYLKYEKTPINKAGKEVGFEINLNPGPNKNLKKALEMLEDKDFSNPAFLISYLPINVVFEKNAEDSKKDIKAPMETRRANGKLDSKKDKDGKDQFYINPATETLRSKIINHLVNGGSISDIKTTIQDQYKGLLKVDDNRFANNNILELDGVKDLKYVRDNLYVVDSFGNLMNIQSGKTKTFINSKLKPNAKGEIYLMIPQANGSEFPLKLNIKKISESEAVLLYEIYKEIITNDNTLDTTVSEVNEDLQEAILKSFEVELNIIGGNKNDIKLQEIVDLLIYQSDNVKSRMQIENGILYYGENEANINNIEDSQNAIINFLVDSKRHQIKINPKFATDNTKTNLKSNSADYLKYLIDNNILSTNAVVNKPTFQGYTNIYLNTGITINNQVKSTQKVAEVSSEVADIEKRRQEELDDINKNVLKSALVKNETPLPNEKDIDKQIESFKTENKEDISKLENPNLSDEDFDKLAEELQDKLRGEPIDFILENGKIKFVKYNISHGNAINSNYSNVSVDRIGKYEVGDIVQVNNGSTSLVSKVTKVSKTGRIIEADVDGTTVIRNGIVLTANEVQKQKEINAKYDAELKALEEQPKVSESGVEVTADDMGLAGAFNTSEMGNDVLDILKEFETEPKVENKPDIEAKKVEIEKQRQEELKKLPRLGEERSTIQMIEWNVNPRLFVDNIVLRFFNEFNVFEDIRQTGTTYKELVKTKEGIQTIKKLLIKVLDEDTFYRQDKINAIYDAELEDLENKSENVRNSQENFLSLSEIKGTVENTQLKETQAEVFNENRKPLSATEQRLINKAISVYQEDASKLTESQKKRLEEYATNYPESWKKICK